MVRTLIAALTSAAMLPALAAGASAQSYGAHSRYAPTHAAGAYEQCIRQQRNRQVTGAVIGGILGAVIGAEIHDDRQDRDRAHRYDRRDRYGYRGRGYRDRGYRHRDRGYRHRRGHYHEEGNDGAVLAGAGLGALAGAAVAGSSQNGCERYLHGGRGYSHGGHYSQSGGYTYANQGYSDPGYDDDWRYEGPAQYSYDDGYASRSSSEVLLGGEDYGRTSRSYSAGASVTPVSTGPCQFMRSGNGAQVYMCQGADGIWRPSR